MGSQVTGTYTGRRTFNLDHEATAPLKDIMRLILLASSVASVASQIFEPADFNVTEALIKQGVNVSAIPQLSGLIERSSDFGCNTAVSSIKCMLTRTLD